MPGWTTTRQTACPDYAGTSRAGGVEGVFDPATLEAIRSRVRYGPGDGRPTWTLTRIQDACPALASYSTSGVWRLLQRLKVPVRRGRPRLFSPDPAYREKEQRLLLALGAVARAPGRVVALFGDEFTYHHWPLVGRDYGPAGGPPPRANRAGPGERHRRIVAALDASTGQVHAIEERAIGGAVFCTFLEQLAAAYPDAERRILILDNWPVHHQPEVGEAAERLGMELLFLPTYAPWLNPIEKLWGSLKDEVLRNHRLAGYWDELQRAVRAFLARFEHGSQALLERVGLLGDGLLASALFPIS
jgi:transposase